jgi:hypothetical protein
MTRKRTKCPAYRHYKPKDLAVVRIEGKDHYLGGYGSEASYERYHRLVAEWLARSCTVTVPSTAALPTPPSLTISELIWRYWEFVRAYYRKNDAPTSEQHCIRSALRPLRRLFGRTPVCQFGPKSLKLVREHMIAAGWCRPTINKNIHRVKRLFAWGVEQEVVDVRIHQALTTVRGLARGRSSAAERPPVRPVTPEQINAALPYLSPILRTMIQFQRLTGCRPIEVCLGLVSGIVVISTHKPRAKPFPFPEHLSRYALGEELFRKSARMTERGDSREHSAPARVPSRDKWPPAWLADLPGMPTEVQCGSQGSAEPAGEISTTEVAPDALTRLTSPDAWQPALSRLIAWFQTKRGELPQEPFPLGPGCRVVRPNRFYQALDRDIAAGPAGVRARYGLQADLADMWNLIEGASAPMASAQPNRSGFIELVDQPAPPEQRETQTASEIRAQAVEPHSRQCSHAGSGYAAS